MLPLRRNCKICSRVSVGTRPCALPQVEHVPSFRHLGSPRSWAGCQFSTTDCVPRKKCSSCEVKSKIIRYCEFCLASILPSPVPVCSSPTETGLCIVGLPRQCIVGLLRQCIVGLPRQCIVGLPRQCIMGLPRHHLTGTLSTHDDDVEPM